MLTHAKDQYKSPGLLLPSNDGKWAHLLLLATRMRPTYDRFIRAHTKLWLLHGWIYFYVIKNPSFKLNFISTSACGHSNWINLMHRTAQQKNDRKSTPRMANFTHMLFDWELRQHLHTFSGVPFMLVLCVVVLNEFCDFFYDLGNSHSVKHTVPGEVTNWITNIVTIFHNKATRSGN